MNRVEQQRAYILKSQSFKETSFIHQIFTRDYGIVSVVSRGSKAKTSKTGSLLQPFRELSISWSGKTELKTLTNVEQRGHAELLKGDALYCGFYVNELVLNLLHKYDSHPVLFDSFQRVIKGLLSTQNIEVSLRQFELSLLEEIGYGLQLESVGTHLEAIQSEKNYKYIIGQGVEEVLLPVKGDVITGATLKNLRDNCLVNKVELKQAKRLMRRLIDHQLDGKILKSRELFL
ncbi:MAG: DNA repair protein RecO [Piscirickettsiaceae bacterium]|nr:MAG: DNA repair protein RecO [Piscirickettsiaceae bacterium]